MAGAQSSLAETAHPRFFQPPADLKLPILHAAPWDQSSNALRPRPHGCWTWGWQWRCCRRTYAAADEADDRFFQTQIEPVLVQRCYKCHSHQAKIEGGLTLDSRSGWQTGGDGGPALVPGAPEKSRLIAAIGYDDADLKMPPSGKLPDEEIALLVEWVRRGAPDPRPALAGAAPKTAGKDWEAVYQERLGWWSLQPVAHPAPPAVKNRQWLRGDVDAFVLAALEAEGLEPTDQADRWVLARRLSFALTGLPPNPQVVERFAADTSEQSYDELVRSLVDDPHFGERWARHWLDVVHYADTHGYEWDVPAKNAWMYRDYLVRALNADVPLKQLVLEQIAGDLVEPRVDAATGLNESLIGPMAMRLGERRHGDNAEIEGVTQEAMTNVIEYDHEGLSRHDRGLRQCHDHKLDAVGQKDYYALAGVFMSTALGCPPGRRGRSERGGDRRAAEDQSRTFAARSAGVGWDRKTLWSRSWRRLRPMRRPLPRCPRALPRFVSAGSGRRSRRPISTSSAAVASRKTGPT